LGLSRIAPGRQNARPTEAQVDTAIAAGVRRNKVIATVAPTPAAAAPRRRHRRPEVQAQRPGLSQHEPDLHFRGAAST
ncbi:MAG: hypothetical protein ACRDGN_08630, partial [bacterium]